MAKLEEGMTQSVQSSRRHMFAEITWEEINDPGTYVERGSATFPAFPKRR